MKLLEQAYDWFSKKPVTKASLITATASLIMATMSAVMSITIIQNSHAIRNSTESLRLQRQEFRLKNRPIIDVTEAQLSGPVTLGGIAFPRSMLITYENKTDILATEVGGYAKTAIPHYNNNMSLIMGSLARGSRSFQIGLTDDAYNEIVNRHSAFTTDVQLTYSGMLGESNDSYRTSCHILYQPERNAFGFSDKQFK